MEDDGRKTLEVWFSRVSKRVDGVKTPVATVCIVRCPDTSEVAKGIAIRSVEDDIFDKRKGRHIALQRAAASMEDEKDISPIGYWKALRNLPEDPEKYLGRVDFKGQYMPYLTDLDQKLIRSSEPIVFNVV